MLIFAKEFDIFVEKMKKDEGITANNIFFLHHTLDNAVSQRNW